MLSESKADSNPEEVFATFASQDTISLNHLEICQTSQQLVRQKTFL